MLSVLSPMYHYSIQCLSWTLILHPITSSGTKTAVIHRPHPIDDQSQLHIHHPTPHRQICIAIEGENWRRWPCCAVKTKIGRNLAHQHIMQPNGKVIVDLTLWVVSATHRIIMQWLYEHRKRFEGSCTWFVSCFIVCYVWSTFVFTDHMCKSP